jgi:hypothetical protein
MGRPVQGHHPDQRCRLPNPAAPPVENDGGTPGQTCAVPGGCSGRAALRSGQCDILGLDGISIVT